MHRKKSLLCLTLSLLLFFFNTSLALAINFSDIGPGHWAYTEIRELSEQNIISGYPDETFKPDVLVNRAEFTSMVIKTLNREKLPVNNPNLFTDINEDFWAYGDILRSAQLGLAVGYPDNTFRPGNEITKAEATSIISKTLNCCEKPCATECEKPCAIDFGNPCPAAACAASYECAVKCPGPCPLEQPKTKECVLKQFADSEEIADWAKKPFARAVKNGLYVNYPDKNYLTPNKNLTRAETAALLYKIRQNPCIVSADYRGPDLQEVSRVEETNEPEPEKLQVEEYDIIIEHLRSTLYTDEVNEVEITTLQAKILASNVLPVSFEEGFKSKKVKQGDLVHLVFDKDLNTEEGTTIIPAGSSLVAEITKLKRGKPFHINGKAELEITNLVTASGEIYPLAGTIQNNEIFEPGFGKCNLKRAGIVTGSVAAFGTLLGLFIGLGNDLGDGTALGAILGGSIGAGLGLMWPGCGVNIPAGEEIYVKLDEDLDVYLED